MEKEKIVEQVELLKEVVKAAKLKVSDDKILEEALKNLRTSEMEAGKDKRVQQVSEQKTSFDEPPTESQLYFFKKRNIDTENLTKDKAREMISKIKEEEEQKR